jgi:hypothetical protein
MCRSRAGSFPICWLNGHHGERLCAREAYNRLPTLSVSLISTQFIEILQVPQMFSRLRFGAKGGLTNAGVWGSQELSLLSLLRRGRSAPRK